MKNYRLKFWTTGEIQRLKEYSMKFRNSSEAYRHILEAKGIPITVTEIKEPPRLVKRMS